VIGVAIGLRGAIEVAHHEALADDAHPLQCLVRPFASAAACRENLRVRSENTAHPKSRMAGVAEQIRAHGHRHKTGTVAAVYRPMPLATTPEALDRAAAAVGFLFVLLMGYAGNQFETRGFECGGPDELLRQVLWGSPGIVAASLLGVTAVNRAAWMAELCDRRRWP